MLRSGNGAHWAGTYEASDAAAFLQLVSPGAVVYNVGANVGYFQGLAEGERPSSARGPWYLWGRFIARPSSSAPPPPPPAGARPAGPSASEPPLEQRP